MASKSAERYDDKKQRRLDHLMPKRDRRRYRLRKRLPLNEDGRSARSGRAKR